MLKQGCRKLICNVSPFFGGCLRVKANKLPNCIWIDIQLIQDTLCWSAVSSETDLQQAETIHFTGFWKVYLRMALLNSSDVEAAGSHFWYSKVPVLYWFIKAFEIFAFWVDVFNVGQKATENHWGIKHIFLSNLGFTIILWMHSLSP